MINSPRQFTHYNNIFTSDVIDNFSSMLTDSVDVYTWRCVMEVGECIRRSLIAPLRGATIRYMDGSVASPSDQGNTLHSLS